VSYKRQVKMVDRYIDINNEGPALEVLTHLIPPFNTPIWATGFAQHIN